MKKNLTQRENRGIGALIGTFVGDALGMPVEGWHYRQIRETHGSVTEMLDARLGKGTFTDDTQMMVATAKSLIASEGIDLEHIADAYLNEYQPDRGYGRGTVTVFQKWRQGEDIRHAAKQVFDGGSFGNGGSMRIAPVGILFAGQPERLEEGVRKVCGLTHAHPLGIGSSFLQAFSVGKAYQSDGSNEFHPSRWVDDLLTYLPEDLDRDKILSTKLNTIKNLLREEETPASPAMVNEKLGCTSKAFESVPASIYAFLGNSSSFEEALIYAVGLGGDTDTIGAMTGAISGAYHGVSAVPERWWSALETGQDGRDDIVEMSRKLVQMQENKSKSN